MKISEIILENNVPGWEEVPKRFNVLDQGEIIIGMRYGDNDDIVGALFHYYDNSDEPLFTIRVQNGNIYEYVRGISPNGKLIGNAMTIDEVRRYFANAVSSYLNTYKE
jgi:hypothetical protein